MRKFACAVILTIATSPVGAQIISTSVPRDTGAGGKKWNAHFMISPLAGWQIRDYILLESDGSGPVFGQPAQRGTWTAQAEVDTLADILVAGEFAFAAGSGSFGIGGWYNKIGSDEPTYTLISPSNRKSNPFPKEAEDRGNVGEVHVNGFYKDVGLQGGAVFVSQDLIFDESRTDFDAYLVYKRSIRKVGSFSVGAGIYRTGELTTEAFGEALTFEPLTRPSGFATMSFPVYRGLTLDASYWYIGKSSAAKDSGANDGMNRWLVGIGYTF